jgi:hypothetical protein
VTDHVWFLCVCEREWCWCTNRVPTLDTPCFMCLEGSHQEHPDTILRAPETDDEPWAPMYFGESNERPSLTPGCCGPILLMALAAWAVVIAVIVVIRRLVAG